MPEKVLVTGAAGFVGKYVCEILKRDGYDVLGLIHSQDSAQLEGLGIPQIKSNLLDPNSYERVVGEVDFIVHLGADAKFGKGSHYYAINRDATQSLVDLAERSSRIKRFVYISTIGVVDRAREDLCLKPLDENTEPNPSSDYGRSKWQAEEAVAQGRVPFTILRLPLVVGDGMRVGSHIRHWLRLAAKGGVLSRIAFPGRFSIVHAYDVARAVSFCLQNEKAIGKTYFVTEDAMSLNEIWRVASTEKSLKVPLGWLKNFLISNRLGNYLAKWLPFSAKALILDALVADGTRLNALGFKPAASSLDAIHSLAADERGFLKGGVTPLGWSWVTGAASGLGEAMALELAKQNRRLVLLDKNEIRLNIIAQRCLELGAGDVEIIVVDLANLIKVEMVISRFEKSHPVEELSLIAGFGGRGTVTELSEPLQLDMICVNFATRVKLARWAARWMKVKGRGRIVLVSSSSAFQPLPMMSVYAATNAGLLSFGEAIRAELSRDGIDVHVICPGGMATQFQNSAGVRVLANDKLAQPAEIAKAIMAQFSRSPTTLVIGPRAKPMLWLAKILPRNWQPALWMRLMTQLR